MKRRASAPAVDRRTRIRGGAADVARAEVRDAALARKARADAAAKKQAARAQTAAPNKKQKNLNLYEDQAGNIKARKKPKQQQQQQAKKAAFSLPARGGGRPEDKYGVRNRRGRSSVSVGKSNSLSVSRDHRAASSRVVLAAA